MDQMRASHASNVLFDIKEIQCRYSGAKLLARFDPKLAKESKLGRPLQDGLAEFTFSDLADLYQFFVNKGWQHFTTLVTTPAPGVTQYLVFMMRLKGQF